MSWRTGGSEVGQGIQDTEPFSSEDLLCRDEELRWLMSDQRKRWHLINGRLSQSGVPMMAEGTYGALMAYPPAVASPAVVPVTTTPGSPLWTVATYSPILGNSVLAPSAFRLAASGTIQTSTSALTCAFLPAIGQGTAAASSGAPTAGYQTLGVSGLCTLASTLTCPYRLEGELTIRSVGTAGTAYFAGTVFIGVLAMPAASGTATVSGFTAPIGYTVATADFTGVTSGVPGMLVDAFAASTTVTITTQQVHFASWN